MGRAIRYTCSHCRRERAFRSQCRRLSRKPVVIDMQRISGESGAVLTLNAETSPGTELLDSLPSLTINPGLPDAELSRVPTGTQAARVPANSSPQEPREICAKLAHFAPEPAGAIRERP